MNKNTEEKKYQIELEVVEVGKTNSPAKMMKQTRKNIKKRRETFGTLLDSGNFAAVGPWGARIRLLRSLSPLST